MKKTISHRTYLQALGLFSLAQKHIRKGEEFEAELTKLLEIEPYGHVSDTLYDNSSTERDFDAALKLEDIEVETN